MATITQDDFDNAVTHTIRIELKDGSVLFFNVIAEAKKAFAKLLRNDTHSELEYEFLWIYIPEDRFVFINKNEIIRITFCFEPIFGEVAEYVDNFNVKEKTDMPTDEEDEFEAAAEEVEFYLPQLVIMHNRQLENGEIVPGVTMKTEGYFGNVSSYSSLNLDDFNGLGLVFFEDREEWILIAENYIQFVDDDGEENFMPLKNLSVIEMERPFLLSDEELDKYLERKPKKQPKRKK